MFFLIEGLTMVNDGDMTLSNVIGGPYYPHCIPLYHHYITIVMGSMG
jgi:hypothetical protein